MKLDISNIAFKSILPNKTMEVLCVGDMYDLLKELLGIRKWLLYRNEKVIEIKYHYEIKEGHLFVLHTKDDDKRNIVGYKCHYIVIPNKDYKHVMEVLKNEKNNSCRNQL